MNKSLRNIFSVVFALLIINTAKSQQPLGLVIGDFNTPYSVSMNPANVASHYRYRAYVNWWGSSLDVQSSFANGNGWNRKPARLTMTQNWTPKSENENWSMNYLNETYGPSLYVMADRKVGFGLGMKGVAGFNFSGVNPDLGNVLKNGATGWANLSGNAVSQTSPFAFNTEKYQEWYLSFGSYAGDANYSKGIKAFKWGATTKMLIGMGAAHLSASELNIKSEGNNKFIINDLLANYSYTDQSSASNTMVRPLGLKFDLMTGFGAGIDVGFVYEYRPGVENSYSGISQCDREMARTYRWKFGASLTDIGFISYDGSSYSVTAKDVNYTATNVFQIDQMYGANTNPAVDQFDQMGNMASTLGSTPKSTFTSYTPMALNMQWDYRAGKWHLGAYWIHNLKPVDMPGLRRASTFSVVPRRQTERLEYGFPVSFVQNYSTLNVGAYLRVGPLIVGSNNLAGLGQFLNNSGTQSASFYIGIRSKIGNCSREVYDESDMGTMDTTVVDSAYLDVDSTVTSDYSADTVFIKDTIVLRDTIVKTEVKTVIKRDTVVVTKNVNTTTKDPSVLQALNDCQKREADLKKRLTEIEAREAAANNKNKVCESDLQKWRVEAEKCKLESDRIKAEGDKIKVEADRLKAENDRLKAVAFTPVDKQAKRCDSLLLIELLKNQKLLAELADAKKATVDCNAKLLDALNKAKLCESELANEKNKSNQLAVELANAKKQIESLLSDKKRLEDQLKAVPLGEDCTPYKNKIAELEKLLAAERLKTAQLTADLGNCNKSLETLKAQLAAEQAKVKNLEVKNSDCDKAKAALLVELEAAKKKVTELEEKLKTNNTGSDCSKTRDSLNQALIDLETSKNAYDALMAEYQDCLKTSKSYKDKLKACEDKLAAGSSDASALDALKAEIAKLKITITELNGEVAAGKKSLEACQESLNEKDALIQSLQDQLKGKNADISALQSQLRTAQTQLNDVKARLAKCEEEKANLGTSNEPTGMGTGTPGGGIAPSSPGGN